MLKPLGKFVLLQDRNGSVNQRILQIFSEKIPVGVGKFAVNEIAKGAVREADN